MGVASQIVNAPIALYGFVRTVVAVCDPALGLRWPISLARHEVARATPRRSPDMQTVAPQAQPQGAFDGINGLRPAGAGPLQ